MEQWNLQWFAWMAAGYHPNPWALPIARWSAVNGSLVAAALVAWLLVGRRSERWYLLGSLLVCLVSALLAHRLAMWMGHPRPFVLGLSPAYIDHAARGSLPSVHASALFAVAFCGLWSARLRPAGWALLAVALLVGWARVYCGIHFPFDIVAGAAWGWAWATLYAWVWQRAALGRYEARSTSVEGLALPRVGVPE